MSPRKRHTSSSFFLDLYACFLLPAYTLLFAGSVEWFSTNFSVRAVLGEDYYWGFVLWGVLAAAYFLVLLTRLAGSLTNLWLRLFVHLLTLAACSGLVYSLAIPYLPDQFPRYSQLHILLAFGACVLLMASLLLLLLAFRREAPGLYRLFLPGWIAIVAICGVLFGLVGIVSTALEVFFTLSTVLFTRRLWLLRRQEGKV